MNTTVSALQAVYVKVGGSLTDTYDGIADGAPVGGYSLISDVLKAIFVKCGGSLSTVYNDISTEAVSEYSQNADIIGAVGKVVELGGNLEPVTVKSSGTQQTVTPQAGVDGFDTVTVSPMVLQGAAVNPSTTQQTITPEQGVDGFNSITATPVTAAIDANITAGNIKKDVEILGVTGSYEGGGGNLSFHWTAQNDPEMCGTGNMTGLVINEGVLYIDKNGFYDCRALKSIDIPSTVVDIGENAFYNCQLIQTLTIPNNVTGIGANAFYNAINLETVDLTAFDGNSIPNLGYGAFDVDTAEGFAHPANFKFIFADQNTLDAFASALGWQNYSQYFEVAQV